MIVEVNSFDNQAHFSQFMFQGGCHLDFDGKQVIVGVLSTVAKNCSLTKPSVFTKVSSYINWISRKTGIEIN